MNRTIRYFLYSLIIFSVYVFLARASLYLFSYTNGNVSPIWPPAGFAVAVIFLQKKKYLLAVYLAAFFSTWITGTPVFAAMGVAIGNTLGNWLAAVVMTAGIERTAAFEKLSSVKHLILGAVFGSLLSAAIGTFSLWSQGVIDFSSLATVLYIWVLGDALAILLITPFVLSWSLRNSRPLPSRAQLLEVMVALVGLILVTVLSFGYWHTHRYLVFIFLTWLSVRFSVRVVTSAVIIMGAIAIPLSLVNIGPFIRDVEYEGLIFLQLFLSVAQITSLMLASSISHQRQVETELRQAKAELGEVVRKRTAKLKVSEQRFKVALQNSPVVVFNQNKKLVYTWIHNPFFGFKAQHIIGKTDAEIFERKRVVHQLTVLKQKVLESGETQRSEINIGSSQDPLFYDFTLEPLLDSNNVVAGINGVAVDITDRKKLEENKDEFLGIASHELRTPLTSIKGFVQILERMVSSQDRPKEKLYLQKTRLYVDRLNGLVADLLDISKIQAGKLQMNVVEFDIDQVVQDAIEGVEYMESKHRIEKTDTVHQVVNGDQVRIEQVVTNLLTNAIKYSPQADRIIVRTEKRKDSVVVSVQDFGYGIAKSEQQRLFQRFYRVERTSQRVAGLGVGLYISMQIVRRHGGQMWVESKEGKGSTFFFSLPV